MGVRGEGLGVAVHLGQFQVGVRLRAAVAPDVARRAARLGDDEYGYLVRVRARVRVRVR